MNPCAHHRVTFRGFRDANRHLEPDELAEREAAIMRQCCDHPRACRT